MRAVFILFFASFCALPVFSETPTHDGAVDKQIVGIGHENRLSGGGKNAAMVSFEWRTGIGFAFLDTLHVLTLAAEIDDHQDTWFGVGLSSEYDFTDHWFTETSLLYGYYSQAEGGTDLGSDGIIRFLFGIGYRFENNIAVTFALSHMSNGYTGDTNPGTEHFSLRFHRPF